MKEITIKIRKGTGEIELDVTGFAGLSACPAQAGKACLDATEVFEKALGVVEKRTPKPEMYNAQTQRHTVKVG